MNKNHVVKSNQVIEASYQLSAVEQRIILAAISLIPKNQIITDDDGKLIWECPNCGNRNQDKMNVARRTCGYIGTQFWNQGRTQEIKERVLHL